MTLAMEVAHHHHHQHPAGQTDEQPEMHLHRHGGEETVVVAKKKGSWRNTIIILVLIVSIGAILYYHSYVREKQEAKDEKAEVEKERVVDKAMNFARVVLGIEAVRPKAIVEQPVVARGMHGAQSENTRMVVTENSDSMLKLAIGLRASGMKLKGVSQCRYTQIQREAFGGRDSEARRVIESIYTECRSRDMCPNIRGYPTWTLNDRQWPGNRSANALRAMLEEAKTTNMKSMLQGPSEPVIEMIPDAQNTEQTGDEELSPEAAAALLNQIKTKDESDDYGDAIAEVEAGKIANLAAASDGVVVPNANVVVPETKTLGGFDAAATGGTLPFVVGGFVADTATTSPPMGVKKENVRGVSKFAPLNVPDMPGTAPFVLRQEQHDDQTRQGNAPRASSENHKATVGVMGQHIAGFLQEETHVATRNINADSYSLKRFPHASDITTGEAFTDKTIVHEKN